MSVHILHPGLLTTIQDRGRFGSQKYGVIVSGAMDALSLRIANILVGNDEEEAALECTLLGPTLQFEDEYIIVITGGNFTPTINGTNIPMWRPLHVKSGDILKLSSARTGCRAYIAIAGGFKVPNVLESKSTYIKAKLGGYKGRALQKGDVLSIEKQNTLHHVNRHLSTVPWFVNTYSFFTFQKHQIIRVIHGSEYDKFNAQSQSDFIETTYSITTEADRMGYRLHGTPLTLAEAFQLLSESVTYGTIQVPPNGQPIILMADRQTTGGYPKIAQVITADLPKLAQMQPTNTIQFQFVTIEEAEQALFKQEQAITRLTTSIQLKNLK